MTELSAKLTMQVGLVRLATFIAKNDLQDEVFLLPSAYLTQDRVREIMAANHGGWSKHKDGGNERYTKKLSETVSITFYTTNPSCKRVKVGTEEVAAYTRDVYEWECE